MFEADEVGARIEPERYAAEVPSVRKALLDAQQRLASADFRVIVVVGGVRKAGRGEVVNTLLEWMDARGIETHATWEPTDEERERPEFWRFWRLIPPTGRTTIFYGGWYTDPILERVFGKLGRGALDRRLDRIVEFERMLVAEKTLLLKLWLHISKKEQKSRLKTFEKDPLTRWRVSKQDWTFAESYDELRETSEYVLRSTETVEAPWTIVEGTDPNHRNIAVARALLQALERRLDQPAADPVAAPELPELEPVNVISRLDLTKSMSKAVYAKKAPKLIARLAELSRELRRQKRWLIIVFEGPDAAGKGGTIRRITAALDARSYKVSAFAAPTDEERVRPYLWRFWRHLPRRGQITIYDRSWYGRVLVERVEGFCAPSDWQRAYREINEFETELVDFGTIVMKFWLAISPEEQLERFKSRQETPYKQYKIGADDWRNRGKWDAYTAAACEMIEKTSTLAAPWLLIEAEDKDFARHKVLKTLVKRLKHELG